MSKNGLEQVSQEITVFNGVFDFITSKWADIENCVDFLSKEMHEIKIVDNGLFDEIGRLNAHLNYNKLKQLEHQHAEIDKKLVEILNHFKNEHIPHKNLVILFEFTLCCPGTNAAVERVFSVGNYFCEVTSEKSHKIEC
ncbi:dimer_Tnp_hAT domain-containing protein [Trichonephila clavipes]|nr:dimer_Tnp_hAT domain-containing protein [Trichonephila clavipes]